MRATVIRAQTARICPSSLKCENARLALHVFGVGPSTIQVACEVRKQRHSIQGRLSLRGRLDVPRQYIAITHGARRSGRLKDKILRAAVGLHNFVVPDGVSVLTSTVSCLRRLIRSITHCSTPIVALRASLFGASQSPRQQRSDM